MYEIIFTNVLYQVGEISFYSLFLCFECCYCITLGNHVIISLPPPCCISVMHSIHFFLCVEPPLHSQDKFHLIMTYNLIVMLLGSLLDLSFFWDGKVILYICNIYISIQICKSWLYVIVGYSDIQLSRY